MEELSTPEHENFPLGKVLRRRRVDLSISPDEYLEQLRFTAEELGYGSLELFKPGNRGAYNNAERAARISKWQRLEVMCSVLHLPVDLFLRQNEEPVLGFALNYNVTAGSNVNLFYQPSIAIPLRNHSIISSENATSSHVIEALAFFLSLSNGNLTLISRRNQYVATAVVLATILIATREAQDAMDGGDLLVPDGDFITNASDIVADHCRIGKERLIIPCNKELMVNVLNRITVYSLDEETKINQAEGVAEIARLGPVTYWLVSDRNGDKGFVSLGEKNFLQCSAHDSDLLKQRFLIPRQHNSGYSKVNPLESMAALFTEASDMLDIEFATT